MVLRLRLCESITWARIQFLVEELRPLHAMGAVKNKTNKNKITWGALVKQGCLGCSSGVTDDTGWGRGGMVGV